MAGLFALAPEEIAETAQGMGADRFPVVNGLQKATLVLANGDVEMI